MAKSAGRRHVGCRPGAGSIDLLISFALADLSPARPLGDPVPLVLSAMQLTRGLLYFPWRPVVLHLIFVLFLALTAAVILRLAVKRAPDKDEATRAGRSAAFINVGVVAIVNVDAFMVDFWYLAAGGVSLLLTGFIASLFAHVWHKVAT